MEKKEREAFNFYKSYFDVYKKLMTIEEKVSFIDALLNKQFLGIEPVNLIGLAEFAYISQKHSVDKQVKGWEDKTKQTLSTLTPPPTDGEVLTPTKPPCQQEKEKGKGQVEYTKPEAKASDNESIDFDGLLLNINNVFKRSFEVVNQTVKNKYKATMKQGYTKEMIKVAILNCHKDSFHRENNYKYCTVEYFSRPKTLDMYGAVAQIPHSPNHGKIMLVDQIRILDHD